MNIGGLRLDSSNLALCFCTLLKLGHLLTLNRRSSDLLTEDDVTNFASSQRCYVDAVPLAKVLGEIS